MITAQFIQELNIGSLQNFSGQISSACIDSRKVKSGTAFFALKGEYTDGHRFVEEAIAHGAILAVVSQDWFNEKETKDLPLWIVESPQTALQALARAWRARFDIPVLAITGTNGKTTTRAMCAHILETAYKLHTTTGNLNNQLGLPLTLLELSKQHEFSLVELGTNHFGEIEFLCSLCQPTAGLITNIGYGHIEFFHNLAGVARAKQELFSALPPDGIAFVNLDDTYIANMSTPGIVVTFGMTNSMADYYGRILSYDDYARPTIEINRKQHIRLPIPGRAAALNALAAFAVGSYFRVNEAQIVAALQEFDAVDQRFNIINTNEYQIINDAYNANPNSTAAALNTFAKMKLPGRRLFVFGDMFELGAQSEDQHRKIGKLVSKLDIDHFFAYGPLSQAAADAARATGMTAVQHFSDKAALIDYLRRELREHDTLLVKGSRGNYLEEVIEGIT